MLGSSSKNKNAFTNVLTAYQGFIDEPVPSVMFDALVSGRAKFFVEMIKLAVAFILGALLVTVIGQFTQRTESNIVTLEPAEIALSSHEAFSNDAVYPVRVSSEDIEHLNGWVSYRLGRSVSAPALDQFGFALLGANIVPDGNRVSAQFVYENKEQQRISLFQRLISDVENLATVESDSRDEMNWLSWQTKRDHFVLVGAMPDAQMRSLYEQLCQC